VCTAGFGSMGLCLSGNREINMMMIRSPAGWLSRTSISRGPHARISSMKLYLYLFLIQALPVTVARRGLNFTYVRHCCLNHLW